MIEDDEMKMMQMLGAIDNMKDEEIACEHFHNHDGTGYINTCVGNEPYSCRRAKKEGLCHKLRIQGSEKE